ncbi:hypothetical protein PSP6_210309 [Paraburkholderia tropica]|nr:hypothetical protein PSP6_210309 [Paraburkholderia tropica]
MVSPVVPGHARTPCAALVHKTGGEAASIHRSSRLWNDAAAQWCGNATVCPLIFINGFGAFSRKMRRHPKVFPISNRKYPCRACAPIFTRSTRCRLIRLKYLCKFCESNQRLGAVCI